MFLNSVASAETTRGGDGPSYNPSTYTETRPCTKWFLFFCIGREGDVEETSYATTAPAKQQPFEPAMTQHLGSKGAPVMGPFQSQFNRCAPGCTFTNWGVWGDKRHQVKKSCHNSGSAIDVHAIRCGGKTSGPGSSRFKQFVGCMDGSNQLSVIFGHGEHKNHVHIALTQCQRNGVGKIRTR